MSMEEAFKEVTDLKSETNWMVVGFPDGSKALALIGKGTGGIDEMAAKFDDKEIMWAGLLVKGVDQQENVTSIRPKIVRISFNGKTVPVMKRNRTLQFKAPIDKLFQGVAIDYQCSTIGEVEPLAIAMKLLASGGAHKPTHWDFGGGQSISLQEAPAGKREERSAAVAAAAEEAPAAESSDAPASE